jgi:CheY-like chemotaxis protein
MDERSSLMRQLAHELRDALSPMRSAVDLLRLRRFDAESAQRTADKVERGVDYALAAIDAFVLAEQCENGTLALAPSPQSLQQLAESARDALTARLAERSQRCELVPSGAPVAVSADALRSRQVIGAMLELASAVAPAHALIQIETTGDPGAPAIRVRFPVEAPAAAGESWFAGYRARPRGSRMALRSARQVMALQRGTLSLSLPAPGDAQLVAAFAPADRAALSPNAAGARADAPRPASRQRVLLVEDSQEVRGIYREALVELGYAVIEVATAEEALAQAADAADVALIDIHLPGMNGYRLARSLKARSAMRLVMLSGMTLDETTVRLSRDAGFDDCIDKAAGPKALHALLQQAGAARPSASPP